MSADLPTRDDVVRAAETIRGRVRRTPLLDGTALAPGLSLKAELLQHTGSFKARGVTNRLSELGAGERERGVAGATAGNHAIALAWGAANEGVDCVDFSWAAASQFKLDRARAFGTRIDTEAADPAEAFVRLEHHLADTGATSGHNASISESADTAAGRRTARAATSFRSIGRSPTSTSSPGIVPAAPSTLTSTTGTVPNTQSCPTPDSGACSADTQLRPTLFKPARGMASSATRMYSRPRLTVRRASTPHR